VAWVGVLPRSRSGAPGFPAGQGAKGSPRPFPWQQVFASTLFIGFALVEALALIGFVLFFLI
jgi:F0F1-type ATP synthase membrane subunit c/vacuolar-type H+-ATPase subunit K